MEAKRLELEREKEAWFCQLEEEKDQADKEFQEKSEEIEWRRLKNLQTRNEALVKIDSEFKKLELKSWGATSASSMDEPRKQKNETPTWEPSTSLTSEPLAPLLSLPQEGNDLLSLNKVDHELKTDFFDGADASLTSNEPETHPIKSNQLPLTLEPPSVDPDSNQTLTPSLDVKNPPIDQGSAKLFASCEQNFSSWTFLPETRMIFATIFPCIE